jgi:hypothetical protein
MTYLTISRASLTAMCLAVASTWVAAASTEARSQSEVPSPKTVTGQVSAVEGEFHMAKDDRGEETLKLVDKAYIVTTPTGEKIQLTLTRETKVPTRANPGDRVEATISQQGQTLSVRLIEEGSVEGALLAR